MIVVEHRPNLSILNVYIGFEKLSYFKQKKLFEERLRARKTEKKLCIIELCHIAGEKNVELFSFFWPEELEPYHPVLGQLQSPGLIDHDEMCVRLRLSSRAGASWKNYAVVKGPTPYKMGEKKDWSVIDTFLRCVYSLEHQQPAAKPVAKDEASGCNLPKKEDPQTPQIYRLHCNLCMAFLGPSFTKGRFLPLPSVNWADLAPTWFCGCLHTREEPEGESSSTPKKVGKKQREERRPCDLHASVLDPGPGDIFWAPGFIHINRGHVNPEFVNIDGNVVNCGACKHVLGHYVSPNTIQFWSYAVMVVEKGYDLTVDPEDRTTCTDTFLDIINGAVSESFSPVPSLYFISPTRILFISIIDRELQIFSTHDIRRYNVRLEGRVVRKCLIRISDKNPKQKESSSSKTEDACGTGGKEAVAAEGATSEEPATNGANGEKATVAADGKAVADASGDKAGAGPSGKEGAAGAATSKKGVPPKSSVRGKGAVPKSTAGGKEAVPRSPASGKEAIAKNPASGKGAVPRNPTTGTGAIPKNPATGTGAIPKKTASGKGGKKGPSGGKGGTSGVTSGKEASGSAGSKKASAGGGSGGRGTASSATSAKASSTAKAAAGASGGKAGAAGGKVASGGKKAAAGKEGTRGCGEGSASGGKAVASGEGAKRAADAGTNEGKEAVPGASGGKQAAAGGASCDAEAAAGASGGAVPDKKWQNDPRAQVITVTEEIFSSAVELWKTWSRWLPNDFKKDKTWDLALFPKDSMVLR